MHVSSVFDDSEVAESLITLYVFGRDRAHSRNVCYRNPGNRGLWGKAFAKILLGRAITILDAQMVRKSDVFCDVFYPLRDISG